jgi:hypothetical protein
VGDGYLCDGYFLKIGTITDACYDGIGLLICKGNTHENGYDYFYCYCYCGASVHGAVHSMVRGIDSASVEIH